MKSYSYKNEENNLIRKMVNFCRENPKKVRNLCVSLIVLIVICIGVSMLVEESKKQKYVIYDGENLNEAKYPGYK